MPPLLPARDVGGFPIAAQLAIGAVGDEVIAGGVVLARTDVGVGPAPRVERDFLPQVGTFPVGRARVLRWGLPQGGEPLRRGRVATVVESVSVERRAEHLDLRARCDVL